MRRSQLIASLPLFLGIALVASHALAADFRGKELTIATWNIEWLNAALHQGKVKRDDSDYAALRRYAQDLKADVIAVQEVDGEQAARRVFPPDAYEYHFSTKQHALRVGFVIRKGVMWQASPEGSTTTAGLLRA